MVWVRFRVYNGVWRHVGLYKVGIDILKSFRYFEIVIEPLPPFRTSDMLRNTKKKIFYMKNYKYYIPYPHLYP